MDYFVQGQYCVFMIAIVTGECAIMMLQKLQFGVCYLCYCILIYDDVIILLFFFLNDQWRHGEMVDGEMV